MSTKRTFASYQQLLMAIKRNGFKDAGTTATLLLETFVYHNGQLKSDFVVEKGLCEKGKFTEWRDELIKKGWLVYNLGDYSKHSPGTKLVKYINQEKMKNCELATTKEVSIVDQKVVALEERVSLLEEAIKNVIEEFDPPVTKEKIEKRLKIVKNKN